VFAGTESGTAGATSLVAATASSAAVAAQVKSDFDTTGYGVAYSMGGFTVGYNASEKEFDVAARQTSQGKELSGFSAGYTAGNFAVAINTSEAQNAAGATTEETQTIGASYNLGGGAKVYAASTSYDKKTAADENTVGISFSF